MEWTNADWMQVYETVVQAIMLFDLQHMNDVNGRRMFSEDQNRALKIKEKLEYMFREHDETPGTAEV